MLTVGEDDVGFVIVAPAGPVHSSEALVAVPYNDTDAVLQSNALGVVLIVITGELPLSSITVTVADDWQPELVLVAVMV